MSAALKLPADHIINILMKRHENDNDSPEVCEHHDVRLFGRRGYGQCLRCEDCGEKIEMEYDQ